MNEPTKWTPGPWRIEHGRIGRKKRETERLSIFGDMPDWPGMCICNLIGAAPSVRTVELEHANAYLIAAAPDLYEALDGALRAIEGAGECFGNMGEMRSALAKARGPK